MNHITIDGVTYLGMSNTQLIIAILIVIVAALIIILAAINIVQRFLFKNIYTMRILKKTLTKDNYTKFKEVVDKHEGKSNKFLNEAIRSINVTYY